MRKKIQNTFQHKFSILHDSIVDSLLKKPPKCLGKKNTYAIEIDISQICS